MDTYIERLGKIPYSDLNDPCYDFYDYQTEIEEYHNRLTTEQQQDDIYITIKQYFIQARLVHSLLQLYQYPTGDNYKNNYNEEILTALNLTHLTDEEWDKIAGLFKTEQ